MKTKPWTVIEVVGRTKHFGGTIMASSLADARRFMRESFKPFRGGKLALTQRPFRDGGIIFTRRQS